MFNKLILTTTWSIGERGVLLQDASEGSPTCSGQNNVANTGKARGA